jgi:copper chaperone CopZ
MKIPSLLYWMTVASVFVFALGSEARTWTRAADQKTIEGDFVKADGDKVTINMKGKDVTLPVSALIKEDQDFITAQMEGGGASKEDGKKEDGKKEEAKAGSKEMPTGPTKVVLSGVHLCCSKCEKKMEEAVARYDDIKLEFDQDAGTVTFKGETGQAVEDALFKVNEAGFYGTTDHERLKMKKAGGSTKEYEALDVTGIHICCGKCEKAVKAALKEVPGIEEDTMEKGKSSFKVSGKKITIADLNKALNGVGLNARSILEPK